MKYIDADKLKAEMNRTIESDHPLEYNQMEKSAYNSALYDAIDLIKSLQQDQPDNVLIPRWCLENIENTLRIQHNINNDAKDGETCQDRNIKESLNCVRKLLNGEEITGRERSEPLMKQPEQPDKGLDVTEFCEPINPGIAKCVADHWWEMLDGKEPDKSLEEAAERFANTQNKNFLNPEIVKNIFIAGAEWMAGQGETLEVTDDTTWGEVNDFIHRNCDGAKEIQIRKK